MHRVELELFRRDFKRYPPKHMMMAAELGLGLFEKKEDSIDASDDQSLSPEALGWMRRDTLKGMKT